MTAASKIADAAREGNQTSDRRDMTRVYPAHVVDSRVPDGARQ